MVWGLAEQIYCISAQVEHLSEESESAEHLYGQESYLNLLTCPLGSRDSILGLENISTHL